MFERFSSTSRRVVVQAEAEARALGHGFIGTEHLTLALVGEAGAGSRAHDLLVGAGIDLDELREAVRTTIGGEDPQAAEAETCPRTKTSLPRTIRRNQRRR